MRIALCIHYSVTEHDAQALELHDVMSCRCTFCAIDTSPPRKTHANGHDYLLDVCSLVHILRCCKHLNKEQPFS